MRLLFAFFAAVGLGACTAPPQVAAPLPAAEDVPVSVTRAIEVTRRIEPVAEVLCRSETPQQACDFSILVNRDPRAGVNAFQTIDPATGRPVIILTAGLIRDVRNDDELAFVIGHEAAHHIAQHLGAQQAAAQAGADFLGRQAFERGATEAEIIEAAQAGAFIGARRFSQTAELEADALGTIIACGAGFDPVLGAQFFSQLPDPGDRILGTHPPNAARMEVVRATAAQFCPQVSGVPQRS